MYISDIGLVSDSCIRQIGVLAKAWADRLEIDDSDAKDAGADRVAASWGPIGEFGIKT